MDLSELLAELRDNVLHDRSSQIEGDSDKLWSDTTLVRYLNEAQRRFVRKTLTIVDKRSASSRFQLVAGQDEYDLDPSIIAIKSMRFMGNAQWINGLLTPGTVANDIFTANVSLPLIHPDTADLGRGGHSHLSQYQTPGLQTCNPVISEIAPGHPRIFTTDEDFDADASGAGGVMVVRLYPRPSVQLHGCTVQMRACRLPKPFDVNNMGAVPEIPEAYHLCLVDYAASRALAIVDHDLGDPQRSADLAQKFAAEVEEARQETQRKAFVPMVWGFGRGGFAYGGNDGT